MAIIPNLTRYKALEVTKALCKELDKLDIDYCFNENLRADLDFLSNEKFEEEDIYIKNSDMVVSVGGDGSMLKAAKLASSENKYILGINAGRLAYLCGLDANELHLLKLLKEKKYQIQHRMMLSVKVFFDDKIIYEDVCLNDAVFTRGAGLRLIDLSVIADDRNIADYLADGAIFATPTGSTAYSMSAGGSIVEPTLDAILLTPICPHSLAVRPFVFSGNSRFRVQIKKNAEQEYSDIFLSCDGREPIKLGIDAYAEIQKSEIYASFISIKTDNFIDVLNKKLEIKK